MIMNFGDLANIPSYKNQTAVEIGTDSTNVLDSNDTRIYLLLTNDSDEAIYIKFGAAAALNEGIRLNANGGSYEISPANANLYQGVINAICTSGSKKLLVCEA